MQDHIKQQIAVLNEIIRWIRSNCVRKFEGVPINAVTRFVDANGVKYTIANDDDEPFMLSASYSKRCPLRKLVRKLDLTGISTEDPYRLEGCSSALAIAYNKGVKLVIDRTGYEERYYTSYERFLDGILQRKIHERNLNGKFNISVTFDGENGSAGLFVNPFSTIGNMIENPVLKAYFDHLVIIPYDALAVKTLTVCVTHSVLSGEPDCRVLEVEEIATKLL